LENLWAPALTYSQDPAIRLWSEPTNSNQHSHIAFAKYCQWCYLEPCLSSGNWRLTLLVFRRAQFTEHWPCTCINILLNVKQVVKTRRLREFVQVNEVCIWNARETSQRIWIFHNKKCHQLQINTILPCCICFDRPWTLASTERPISIRDDSGLSYVLE